MTCQKNIDTICKFEADKKAIAENKATNAAVRAARYVSGCECVPLLFVW